MRSPCFRRMSQSARPWSQTSGMRSQAAFTCLLMKSDDQPCGPSWFSTCSSEKRLGSVQLANLLGSGDSLWTSDTSGSNWCMASKTCRCWSTEAQVRDSGRLRNTSQVPGVTNLV